MSYLSPLLITQLNAVKRRVTKKNMDWWCLIDGREGVGKSSLAIQIASYLDKDFNLDKICFTYEAFAEAIRTLPKYSAIVMDESFVMGDARGAMTELNRSARLLGAEARQRNLFVILCIPSIFDMDKYFGLHRTNCLFHVYFDKTYNRGNFLFFPYTKKKQLYLFGKKLYSYSKPKAQGQPIGFSKDFGLINPKDYDEKKLLALKNRESLPTMYKLWQEQRNALIMYIWNDVLKTGNKLNAMNIIFEEYKCPPIISSQIYNIFDRYKDKYGEDAHNKSVDISASNRGRYVRSKSDN